MDAIWFGFNYQNYVSNLTLKEKLQKDDDTSDSVCQNNGVYQGLASKRPNQPEISDLVAVS